MNHHTLKKVITILVSSILFLLMPLTSSAHSGGTDSNGGHWDRSSGTYHYHHGYSAHQHTDLDGDGVEECPYDTKIAEPSSSVKYTKEDLDRKYISGYNTGYDAGKSRGEQTGYKKGYSDCEIEMQGEIQKTTLETREKTQKNAIFICVFFVVPLSAWVTSLFSDKRLKKELNHAQIKHNEELQKVKKRLDHATILLTSGDKYAQDIPDGVHLEYRCIPIKGERGELRPYGDYTVYLSAGGKKYHCRYRCCNASNISHYFTVPDNLEPCKNCVPPEMRIREIPQWHRQLSYDLESK